jgi:hypothetical protein
VRSFGYFDLFHSNILLTGGSIYLGFNIEANMYIESMVADGI